MKGSPDFGQLLLLIAALVVAIGTIYRGVVRPLVRGMRRLSDELAGLRESTLMVREVVQYVAGFVVHTDGRLANLEQLAGVAAPEETPAYQRHRQALDWLERNARERDERWQSDHPSEGVPS